MYDIIAILIPIILAVCIVVLVRGINDNALKRRLAETQTERDIIHDMLRSQHKQRKSSLLSWGISLLAVGFGMCLVSVFDLNADDPLAYGIIFITVGLSLLISFFIARDDF